MSQSIRTFTPNVAEGKTLMAIFWRQVCSLMRNTCQGVTIVAYIPQSREQQRIYHSCLRDLSKQVELDGELRTEIVWKRATLAAFFEETREMDEFREEWRTLGALLIQGQLLTTVTSTDFSKSLASAYLTFLHNVGDKQGVTWSPTSLGREANAANDAAGPRAEAA